MDPVGKNSISTHRLLTLSGNLFWLRFLVLLVEAETGGYLVLVLGGGH